jgi:hypothetical protein
MGRKGFFSSHSKSSAFVVSVIIHAIIALVAVFFVAVTVIQKNEVDFAAKPVNRPKMNLRKLQVPVNVSKPKQQPRLRKQITVAPKLAKVMPDIQMPEIVGVKGGMGSGSGGFGAGATLGFTIPEIDLFGIKGKGEKVFIILDSTKLIMHPDMGGIPAYTLIKDELVRILGKLPPTTVFNILVYDNGNCKALFSGLVPASDSNVGMVDAWLKPLNAVEPGRGAEAYGLGTLGPGGKRNDENFLTGRFERQELWHRPLMISMKEQADTVFLLTSWWGHQRIDLEDGGEREKWLKTAAGRKWLESWEKAKQMLEEENRQRIANGEAPIILRTENAWVMNNHYFPDIERPPEPEFYYHMPREYLESMVEIRKRYNPDQAAAATGLRGSKVDFTLHVIHFKKADGEENEWATEWYEGRTREHFSTLTSLTKGEYRMIEGMEAIKRSINR